MHQKRQHRRQSHQENSWKEKQNKEVNILNTVNKAMKEDLRTSNRLSVNAARK